MEPQKSLEHLGNRQQLHVPPDVAGDHSMVLTLQIGFLSIFLERAFVSYTHIDCPLLFEKKNWYVVATIISYQLNHVYQVILHFKKG